MTDQEINEAMAERDALIRNLQTRISELELRLKIINDSGLCPQMLPTTRYAITHNTNPANLHKGIYD